MTEWKELVKGRIVQQKTGDPVKGAKVQVWDKDLLLNDFLGETTTDEEGYFKVAFGTSDFKDGVYENRPDIFLKVTNPDTGKTTKTPVQYDLEGEVEDDDSVEVMDLAEVKVD